MIEHTEKTYITENLDGELYPVLDRLESKMRELCLNRL